MEVYRSFYPAGQLKCINVFVPQESQHNYCYSSEGIIQSKFIDVDPGKSPIWQEFNDNGVIFEDTRLKGKGLHQKFFDEIGLRVECGELKCIYYDQDGKVIQDGVSKGFYKNEKLMWEEEIKAGKPNGFSRYYYSNGQIKSESNLDKNLLIRDKKFYSRDGVLTCEISYPVESDNDNWNVDKVSEDNYLIKIAYSDEKGGCIGSIKAYDDLGSPIFQYYCDENGRPKTVILDGYKDNYDNLKLLYGDAKRIKLFVSAPLVKPGSMEKFQNKVQRPLPKIDNMEK